ncbi:MAG: diaminopimelate decarboxylase [bacterium]
MIKNPANYPKSFSKNKQQQYCVGGHSLETLAKKYGTPLYIIDQETIEENCKQYTEVLDKYYPDYQIYYAAKANINIGLLDLIAKQGLGADVVSFGELYTALQSQIPNEKLLLHGNNKSDEELRLAVENKVMIVIDNMDELIQLRNCLVESEIAKVLLRFNPDIQTNTHAHIQTGHASSKFGMDKTQCKQAITFIQSQAQIQCLGLHSHIGSQILDVEPYLELVEQSTDFLQTLKKEQGFEVEQLNLGGGMGIAYTPKDLKVDIKSHLKKIIDLVKVACKKKQLSLPKLLFEPGRSIVGDSGLTIYQIGRIKTCAKDTYIFVDGGMADNPRPILYGSTYHFSLSSETQREEKQYQIAGKFCESGDILGKNITLPETKAGEFLLVYGTGAYNYAMASNYNRSRKPAMLLVNKKEERVLVQRESVADLIAKDQPLE